MKRLVTWLILVAAFILILSVSSGWAQSSDTEIFITHVDGPRPDTGPNVTVYFSVLDAEKSAITGLPVQSFVISEDGQEISASEMQVTEEDVGVAVVFVLDVSKSMDYPGVVESNRLQDAKNLIFHFASADQVRLQDQDLSGLVVIYDDPESEQSTVNPLSNDHMGNLYNPLINFERSSRAESLTPLKEGVEQAIRLFQNPTNPDAAVQLPRMRRVIVILSDGLDLVSKKAETEDLINQAKAADISLYTIGIDSKSTRYFDDEALQRLANQTNAEFRHHNSQEAHQDTLALFDRILTQGNVYQVTYPTHAARGTDHRVRVKVDVDQTGVLVGDEQDFSSPLLAPTVEILSVAPDPPSISWQKGITDTRPVTVTAKVSYPDDIPRPPRDIQLAVDSAIKGTMTPTVGDSNVYVSTFDAYGLTEGSHALNVALEDSALGEQVVSSPVNLSVTVIPTPTPTPRPPVSAVVEEAKTNWWIVLWLLGLLLFVVLLLVLLLLRTRKPAFQQMIKHTTGRLKKATMPLGRRTPAKARLVVTGGYAKGREYRVPSTTRVVKVSRDPEFGDFDLGDPHVSNPHFTITFQSADAYIMDEGSTNGTRVNGAPLQPQKSVLLQRDAVIEVGNTKVQFRRVGGTTRVLTGSP
jgi:hypothetical protein